MTASSPPHTTCSWSAGGGAGLRAAIAIAEANPRLDVAVVSKVYPMRSHTVSAEGGAAGVIAEDDTLDEHAYDTDLGQRLARRPGRHRGVRRGGAARAAAAGALGLPVEPAARRPRRGPRLRRHEEDAHLVRRRQDRLPHAARAVPDLAEVRRGHPVRRGLRHQAARRRRPGARRRRGRARRPARSTRSPRRPSILVHRRLRQGLPVHHERQHQHRRRDGAGLPGRRAAEGHGVRPVPPDRAAVHRHPDHRGRPGRGRLAAEQGRLPLPAGLRPGHARRRPPCCAAWSSARGTGCRRRSCTRWRRAGPSTRRTARSSTSTCGTSARS